MEITSRPMKIGEPAPFLRSTGAEHNGFQPWEGFVPFRISEAESDLGTQFREIASVHSKSVALFDSDGLSLTYQELLGRANRIASIISRCFRDGPRARRIAAVISKGDAQGIAAMIGSLFAGCAYFPIDPAWPDAQIDKLLAASRPGIILADASVTNRLRNRIGHPFEPTLEFGSVDSSWEEVISDEAYSDEVIVGPGDTAAIFATSGSTGDPKLVTLSHRAILFDIGRQRNDLFLGSLDRFDLLFSAGFSASLAPIFGALLHGAQLHLFDLNRGLGSLPEWMEDRRISLSTMSVSTLRSVFITPGRRFTGKALRMVSTGSEPLLAPDVEGFLDLFPERVVLQNAMAASETRTYAQYFVIHGDKVGEVVPVGWPVSEKEVSLLQNGKPALAGEITIRSRYLSSGYLNDPELTARKFEVSADGTAVYRTGDLGEWAPDGSLIFRGREDWQVRVRGYRVELLAVEAALRRVPGIANCAVITKVDRSGETRLVAYVSGLSGGFEHARRLRTTLEGALPGYMVPSAFVFLDSLPLNSNGKVDRQLLLGTPRDPVEEVSAATTPVEAELRRIWCRILEIDEFSRNATFLELGGSSLKTLQMQMYMRESFGNSSPARRDFDFYLHATLAEAAAAIEAELKSGHSGSALLPISLGEKRAAIVFFPAPWGSSRPAEVLARYLAPAWSVYTLDILQIVSEHPSYSLKQVAQAVRLQLGSTIAHDVPLVLVGNCFGALTAFEIARQRANSGEAMSLFCPLNAPSSWARHSKWRIAKNAIRNLPGWIAQPHSATRIAEEILGRVEHLRQRLHSDRSSKKQMIGFGIPLHKQIDMLPNTTQKLVWASVKAILDYVPDQYDGQIVLFRAEKRGLFQEREHTLGWRSISTREVEVEWLSGSHNTCMQEPHIERNVPLMARRFEAFAGIRSSFSAELYGAEQ
jgi:acyl-CoA synthetase (AMP-forming)/AMP-acid ligase II/thioesterase domain-containing protein